MWPAILSLVGVVFQTYVNGNNAETVSGFSVYMDQVTTKGSTIQLVCSITNFENGSVRIEKTNSSSPNKTSRVSSCSKTECFPKILDRYSFSADENEVNVSIYSLCRPDDENYWYCISNTNEFSQGNLSITVYTPPSNLTYTADPTMNQDLSNGPVNLICETNCAYPEPLLKWFYLDGGEVEYSTGNVSNTSDCIDQEKKFVYRLNLAQYTTFSNNEDKTVKFKCGIPAVPAQGLASPLYSSASQDIRFAVQVTSVRLTDCSSTPNITITVTSGVPTHLCCYPGISRPSATIEWYIGDKLRKRSTNISFTFDPNDSDHNETIYCKAFNIPQKKPDVISTEHKLYVKVPVTSVTLKDSTITARDTVIVTQGVIKELTCEPGTSRPAPSISWYIGSSVKQNTTSTTYTFVPTNADHNNTIYCTAKNSDTHATESEKPKLYVQVEAGMPEIKNKTLDHLLMGDEVTFVCQTSATRPTASVTWKKGGTLMTHVTNSNSTTSGHNGLMTVISSVRFTPVQADNQKDIVCETAIPSQISITKDTATLIVWWSPMTPTVTPFQSLPWREGQTNNYLQCSTSNMGNPSSSVAWRSQSGSSHEFERLHYERLTFSNDNESVTCTLVNGYTHAKNRTVVSQEIHLDVQYKPIVTIRANNTEGQNITVNEGQYLQALCTAKGNPFPHTVEWLNHTGQTTGILSFSDIDRDDERTYTCRAKATSTRYESFDFTTEKMFYIGVNFAPTVTVTTSIEHSTIRLSCNAVGKPSSFTYRGFIHTWKGQQIQDLRQLDRQVWDIQSPKLEDSGNYTCLVDNGIVDKEGHLIQTLSQEILVEGQPSVLSRETMFAGELSKSSSVALQFYSHPPFLYVKIRRNDVNLNNNDMIKIVTSTAEVSYVFHNTDIVLDGTNVTLNIKNLTELDFSNYTLEIKNSVDTVTWTFFIVSQSAPLTPKVFKLIDKTRLKYFYWVKGFNGGHTQFFIIEIYVDNTGGLVQRLNISEENTDHVWGNDGTYIANLTADLTPGTYSARLYAVNKINRSEYIQLSSTFTVPMQENVNNEETASLTAAAAGGGIAGAVTMCSVGALVILLIRRRKKFTNSQKSVAVVYENTMIDRSIEYRTDEPVVVGDGTYKTDRKDNMAPKDDGDSGGYDTLSRASERPRMQASMQQTSDSKEPHNNVSRNSGVLESNTFYHMTSLISRKNSTHSQTTVAVVYENTMIDRSVEYRTDEPVVVGDGTYKTDSKEKDIAIVMDPPKITKSAILLRDLEEVVFTPDSAAERFSGEFQKFREGMTKEHNTALQNRSRNKYRNLYAYDDTRVVLDIWDDDSDTDYINACYIQGFKKTNAYIASQGPIKNNLNDFWRMVWQTNAAQIVMLTNIIEHGKDKCIKYWPEDGSEMYGRITVTLAARETFSSFVIRTFMVNKDFEPPRQVQQCHFTAWPDKDVPAFCSSLVHFRSKVKAAASACDGPVVVHCSAGVGRTGTFIAIDYLVDEAEELGSVDVVGCVTALREQRVKMVQKEKQYVFVHLSLVEILLLETSVVSTSDFVESYKHLLKSVNGIRQINSEFDLLWKLSPKVKELTDNTDDPLAEQNVIQDDEYMPSYSEPGTCRYGEFIDAAFLPLYRDDNAMIIAKTPTEWTIEKFWNLVYHQQVHTIVMMNQKGVYWPGDKGTFTHGDITISNNGAVKKGSHYVVKLTMFNNGKERDIQLLLFGTWEGDESVPDDPSHVLSALDIVGSNQKMTGNHPVVVHCMDGVERSGLFCVIAALLDRTKIEQDVAISQVIQEIRNRRKNVIPNVEQFEFCHDVVCAFLQQFDSYSNFTFGE